MKPFFAFTIYFLFGLSCFAQDSSQQKSDSTQAKKPFDEPLQLRLRIGEAIAEDDFGDRLGRNEEAALAQNGYSFGVVVQAPIFKHIDFTGDVSMASYDTETAAILSTAISQAPDFNWEVKAGSYDLRNIFIGLNFYVGNRFRVFFNPSYGVSWMRFPLIRIDGQREEDDKSITEVYSEQRFENTRNLSFNFKGGLDYMITKTIGIHYTLEQMNYDVKTDSFVEFLNDLGEQGIGTFEAETTFSTLNHSLGIIVKLY